MKDEVVLSVTVELEPGQELTIRDGDVVCEDPILKGIAERVIESAREPGYVPSSDEAAAMTLIRGLGRGRILRYETELVELPDDRIE